MLRELSRSTLYSSSCPFSSNATRRSSFSTLTINLFPVLREERPKIFFTLSNINLKWFYDQKRKRCLNVVHRSQDRQFIVDGSAAREVVSVSVEAGHQKVVQKSWACVPELRPREEHAPRALPSPGP